MVTSSENVLEPAIVLLRATASAAISRASLFTATSRVTVPPRETRPPPVRAEPAVTVTELLTSLPFSIPPESIELVIPRA